MVKWKNEKLGKLNDVRPAFTLVELLVSISIFVIFLGVVSVSYIGIVRSQRQANDVRKMYSDVRSFVSSLEEDMRLGTIDYNCYAEPQKFLLPPGFLGASGSSNGRAASLVTPDSCPFALAAVDTKGTDPSDSPYLAIINKDQTAEVIYFFDHSDPKHGTLKVFRYVRNNVGDQTDIASWTPVKGYSEGEDGAAEHTGGRALFADYLNVKNLTFVVNPPVNPYEAAHYDVNKYQFQPKVTLSLTVTNSDSTSSPFHMDFQTTLSSRVYSRAP